MSDEFDAAVGDVRVRVKGLKDASRALQAAGSDMEDMRDLMHELGMIVVSRARVLVPYKSGKLQKSIRAGRGKTKAVVRAGYNSRRLAYAGVQHWGWPARNIRQTLFLRRADQEQRAQVLTRFDEGLDQILKENGLK
ncbi:MAG: hypothetical protein KH751_08315 [Actinomyces sp.]|nr:hypothetical protein [Actinomyces sp.]